MSHISPINHVLEVTMSLAPDLSKLEEKAKHQPRKDATSATITIKENEVVKHIHTDLTH